MSRAVTFAIPGDLARKSGGSAYDRRMIAELARLGWDVRHLELPAGYPHPAPGEHEETERLFADLADDTLVLVDGLAFGAMAEIAKREAKRLRLVALVHHPLARETGLSPETQRDFLDGERAALGHARTVIVTSHATARDLRDNYEVSEERLCVSVPGTDAAEPAARAGNGSPSILSVASITPRKDHATLVAALSGLADLDFTCRIVGDDRADPGTAALLRGQIGEAGLSERVTLVGPVDDVTEDYARADIFALASRYEGYGMVFAEAMAWGLPIVACRGGAIADVVPGTAGLLVEPGDVAGFTAALRRLIEEPTTYRSLADGSREEGRRLPTWAQSARQVSRALEAAASLKAGDWGP